MKSIIRNSFIALTLSLALITSVWSETGLDTVKSSANPVVTIETSKGSIKVELFQDKAPVSVKNFLTYLEEEAYNGTLFHRVIPGFMIQGGGFSPKWDKQPTHAPIVNESDNGLKNKTGTLAMARTSDVNSATSQFFINLVDNGFLDYTRNKYGYAVFAEVIEGMDVVKAIAKVKTTQKGRHGDVPVKDVLIIKMSIVEPEKPTEK